MLPILHPQFPKEHTPAHLSSLISFSGGFTHVMQGRSLGKPIGLLLLLLALIGSAYAQQETSATITGRVTDATGAAIAGATIIVANQENGAVRRIQTNSEGTYIATPLIPGRYSLTIE